MINNNIQESYCSLEVSKLLKEKGFKTYCIRSFYEDVLTTMTPGYALEDGSTSQENYLSFPRYYSPTHAIAIEWIRVNFGIWIWVDCREVEYSNQIIYIPNGRNLPFKKEKEIVIDPILYQPKSTPQEATEAGLLYILKNLIK